MKVKRIKCGRPGRYICTLRKKKSKRFGRPVIIGGRIPAPYYGGRKRLRGRGFGSFFGSLFKKLAPVVLPAVGNLINSGIETGSKFAVQQGQKLINRGADYLKQKYGKHANLINLGQDLLTTGANSLLKTGKAYANQKVNSTIQDLINRSQRGRGIVRVYGPGWGAAKGKYLEYDVDESTGRPVKSYGWKFGAPPGVKPHVFGIDRINNEIRENALKRPTFGNPMARGMNRGYKSHPNKLGRSFGGTLLKGPIP